MKVFVGSRGPHCPSALIFAEGFEQHIPKGYIYFAMAFSVFVGMLNLKMKSKTKPVALRNRFADDK
jgi:predicted tellurium resistance membrane protein TerC